MRTLLLVVLAVSGCGSPSGSVDAGPSCDAGVLADGGCFVLPRAGDACSRAGFLCQDPGTALECQVTAWVALPCRGDGGCVLAGGLVSCDMKANLEGDRCASTAEGKGLCTADGKGTLECRDGILVKTNVCRSCSVSGDQVICQP